MDIKDIKNKGIEELRKILEESRVELRKLRFNFASGKTKNVKEIKNLKKRIAQILTIIKEKGKVG
jgi:large subunit ribosomal protein L29